MAVVAELHLYKTLLKIKSIVSAPSFPRYVQATVEAQRKQLDAPSANVQARLFNSGPLLATMTEVVGGIRKILGIEENQSSTKTKRLRASDYANEAPTKEDLELRVSSSQNSSVVVNEEGDVWDGLSDQGAKGTIQDGAHGDSEEEDYDIYASRLARSSDEASMSGASSNEVPDQEQINPDSITEGESEADFERPQIERKSKPPKTAYATATLESTTFLPSLSMGGYFSGSESAEELSDDGTLPRKNRMGQQARRALWEKKFGKNAKHVKAQPPNRDEGWDARRGASAGDVRGKRGRGRGGTRGGGGRTGRGPMSSGANSDPIATREKKTKPAADVPLHPSWEAAKKAKEQKKTIAFQGKKVVFD